MKRHAVMQWLEDGGGRWIFWSLWSLAFVGLSAHWRLWWGVGLFSALLVLWTLRLGPRGVRASRQLRVAHKRAEDARARFYWMMGTQGVPLDVVRQADRLLDEEKWVEAHSLLAEYMA